MSFASSMNIALYAASRARCGNSRLITRVLAKPCSPEALAKRERRTLGDEGGHQVWTSIDGLHGVAKALEAHLGEAESIKLAWRPQTSVEVGEAEAEQLIRLVDLLEEDDDVQTVWGNYEVSDEVLERLA